ncbi:MAG: putative TrmH family tRNA/rRNA methyltransferase [Firmicutes bacterium ADurb.Bin300]|jgi:23S rRNA (guanosine2251-2'-O)-methyltransferase|nr:MAG: putative TrmH family tRNA/rRNA methyltransferase [Firmicutes bacterium ADurb.Bin300]HOD02893.1 23S rRNA (guanosine(2251)-2'-O)-methyltransferase RlmB [Clostridiales bacterium]
MRDPEKVHENDIIFGRNSVAEALRSGRAIDSLLAAKGERSGSIPKLIAMAKEKGIVVKQVDIKKLDYMCAHGAHQGIAVLAAVKQYSTIDDILTAAREKNEPPFIIVCEGIEDPHNLGAIIRTALAAGVHGIIVPERHSAPLSFAVSKASAGAVEYMPVARVVNISAALKQLKERGLWIFCADMDGSLYTESDLKGAIALVIGSEGHGVGRLVKENCDFTIKIPMKGQINSLNASVAAGILIYEVIRQRN